jgi:hypothetical protein
MLVAGGLEDLRGIRTFCNGLAKALSKRRRK